MTNDPNETIGGESTSYIQPNVPAELAAEMLLAGGRYRLIEEIGRGGMGVVWSAEDLTAERKVVLKFVPRKLDGFESAIAQAKASFQKIHELQHQHICPVYALEKDLTFGYYIVMKWLDGETLEQYVVRTVGGNQPLPRDEMTRILRPVAEALDYSHNHEKKIIHRDIKPSNIFLELDEAKNIQNVQLIDFGLASEIRSSLIRLSKTRFDDAGTPPYQSPEQIRGRQQTARTDQYALAVTAYQLLAGYLPFENDDTDTLKKAILEFDAEKLKDQPEHVNAALLKALSKDAGDRFESCVEFVEVLANQSVSATPKRDSRPVSQALQSMSLMLIWAMLKTLRSIPNALLGFLCFLLKRYDQPIQGYEQPIQIDSVASDQTEEYFNRGKAYYNNGIYDISISEFTKVIRLKPNYVSAWWWRGDAWFKKKKYKAAIANYTEAMRLQPHNAEIYLHRGNAWYMRGNYKKAIADYDEVIRLQPGHAKAWKNIAACHKTREGYKKNALSSLGDTIGAIIAVGIYGVPICGCIVYCFCAWALEIEYSEYSSNFCLVIAIISVIIIAIVSAFTIWRISCNDWKKRNKPKLLDW